MLLPTAVAVTLIVFPLAAFFTVSTPLLLIDAYFLSDLQIVHFTFLFVAFLGVTVAFKVSFFPGAIFLVAAWILTFAGLTVFFGASVVGSSVVGFSVVGFSVVGFSGFGVGVGVTVSFFTVTVQEPVTPLPSFAVTVITAVPALTPFTSPVCDTLATFSLLLFQSNVFRVAFAGITAATAIRSVSPIFNTTLVLFNVIFSIRIVSGISSPFSSFGFDEKISFEPEEDATVLSPTRIILSDLIGGFFVT